MSLVQAVTAFAAGGEPALALRPPTSLGDAAPVVFYQAVPLAAGELRLSGPAYAKPDPTALVLVKPLVYWPDGSVRWVGVEGSLGNAPSENALSLTLIDKAPEVPKETRKVVWDENKVTIQDHKGRTLLSLTPEASWVPITKAKEPKPTDAEYLDAKGQYTWAAPLDELTDSSEPKAIAMQVRDGVVEEENPVYTLYRIRGSGIREQGAPESQLEWQLRLRCYHHVPLVRAQMTWVFGWEANRYALSSASLRMDAASDLKNAVIDGIDPVKLGKETLAVLSDPNGANRISISGSNSKASESEAPLPERGVVLLEGKAGVWAIAVPDLNRMGPNHLLVSKEGVELASWSGKSGLGFDLRRSSDSENDFGMRSVDMSVNGTGVGRTTEFALIFGSDAEITRGLALREARRDWIWLPSSSDMERTAAFGPFSRKAIADNSGYFDGLLANLHFVLASRSHWKWFGYANFGDWRTNFARGTAPARGLTAGRWALSGRYGWRNGSGEPYASTLTAGLFLDDRELALAAFDYARHVADVDVKHGSFWRPLQGGEGGMHRRNRDHWSGSMQMQYTTSRGLYLANWLTGDSRIGDVLAEVRDFGKRPNEQVPALSYGARSWIHRYMETLNPVDLATARELLDKSAAHWAATTTWGQKSPDYPLGSIYFENHTRRISEGYGTLVDFHEATGERIYLESLREAVKNDGAASLSSPMLGSQAALGYLLSHGITRSELGELLLHRAKAEVTAMQPKQAPEFAARDYATLAVVVNEKLPPAGGPAFRESNAIRERADAAFLAMQFFGNEDLSLQTAPQAEVSEEASSAAAPNH